MSEGERPLKLLEYGAAGLTVLGIPGRRQKILSDEAVYYITPSSVRIAEALDTIRSSPDQVPATGSTLQEYAKENSCDDVAKMYYDVFRELTG